MAGSLTNPPRGIPLALRYLRELGEGPWDVFAGGRPHNFSENTFPNIARLFAQCETSQQTIYALLPEGERGVLQIAVSAPDTFQPSSLRVPPSITVMADRIYMLWLLEVPYEKDQASLVAGTLAKSVGGVSLMDDGIPLPGTILWKAGQRWTVRMTEPLPTRYRIVRGELTAPKKAAPDLRDPRFLTVDLGEMEDGTPLLWQPGRQTNGFIIATGSSGSGKTNLLRVLIQGVRDFAVPVLIFDFHGDVTAPGLPSYLLSSGTASTHGLNPMEIDSSSGEESGLHDQRGELMDMIVASSKTKHGSKQLITLETAIKTVYERAGIMDDDPATWQRQPPTFADLLAELESRAEDAQGRPNASVEGLLAGVRSVFNHPIFQRQQYLSFDEIMSKGARLDLSKISGGVRLVTAVTLLKRIAFNLRLRGSISQNPVDDSERFRIFIVIDEAEILTSSSDILGEMFNQQRKFGLGAVIASQFAKHLGAEVLGNASTQIALLAKQLEEAKDVAPSIGRDARELLELRGGGDGYYRDRYNKEAVRIQIREFKPGEGRRA